MTTDYQARKKEVLKLYNDTEELLKKNRELLSTN